MRLLNPSTKTSTKLIIAYVALVHLLLLLVLWKSDFIERVELKLGKQPPETTSYYDELVAHQLRVDGQAGKDFIVFIGDSITQGLCASCVADKSVNYGIGHDTTVGVLRRLPRYKSLSRAKAVVLAIGINDLRRRGNAETFKNLKTILSYIPQGVQVVFSAVLPVDLPDGAASGRLNSRIRELNARTRLLCESQSNCHYIDSGLKMTDGRGGLKEGYHAGDGVHLTAEAYRVWIGDLKVALSRLPAGQAEEAAGRSAINGSGR